MREILFRGKIKGSGEWVEGNLATVKWWLDGSPITVIIPSDSYLDPRSGQGTIRYVEVIPETVGQWTGRYDRINFKKIYEDDVVEAMMDHGPAGWIKERIIVEFAYAPGGYQWKYFDMNTMEVIGNIHDNPDILRGE